MVGDSTFGIPAGATEIQFNYDFTGVPTGTLPTDPTKNASFVFGGITYSASGPALPTDTDNNFVFSGGKFIGSLGQDNLGDTIFTAASAAFTAPDGFTASGGGGVSAPEIDPSSSTAALTLLAGGLAMLFSGRRTLKAVR